MSQADILLASINDSGNTHVHEVRDVDNYFVIDPDTRVMENVSPSGNTLMQFDHKSEIYTFELPRYIEGHDMSLCNRVRVHFNNVDGMTNRFRADVADIYDLGPSPDNPDVVICTWEIRREATQFAGTLNFLVQYACVLDDGEIDYEWHTDIYDGVLVKEGRNNGDPVVLEYSNVLEQWYQKLFADSDSVANESIARMEAAAAETIASVQAEAESAIASVQAKADEALASIPEDYTTVNDMAKEALRKKANAIIIEAEGETIFVDDSSDSALLGLRIFGKTTQAGTPSPDSPVDLVSVSPSNITFMGKKLNQSKISFRDPMTGVVGTDLVRNGITFSVDNDTGCVTVNGTATDLAYLDLSTTSLPSGEYILTGCPTGGSDDTYFIRAVPAHDALVDDRGAGVRFTLTQAQNVTVRIAIRSGTTVDGLVFKPMIRLSAATDDTFEPWLTSQAFYIDDPLRVLSGIPVNSGGTYTDANGQQWVADEIDFERGVYIQRLGVHEFDGSTDEYWQFAEKTATYDGVIYINKDLISPDNAYCSRYIFSYNAVSSKPEFRGYFDIHYGQLRVNAYGFDDADAFRASLQTSPMTLVCPLAEPIETPLSDAEIAVYKALYTNYHDTTIFNDAGAHMAVKYNADTLIFLRDNQPQPSDEQVQAAVDAWLTKYFTEAEGVSF